MLKEADAEDFAMTQEKSKLVKTMEKIREHDKFVQDNLKTLKEHDDDSNDWFWKVFTGKKN